ncbi:histidine phosphatase family protein [Chlorobium phaeovibrioides]|uniref:SixA phosphatase family protein n=1 Tax=Chlorobium phaeovibrioides TaxID=1094 RepID=UPI000F83B100|nr:histidine phosphatase family protein [Chlorobium phaeovibrioides]RTY36641.1 histidine phosphatase family protein [Chlorobium phaeovibrioides]
MKTLYLARHAKSDWNSNCSDFERTLNEKGMNDAPLIAAAIAAKKGPKPDILISSPAKRALSTAEAFAEAFGIGKETIHMEMGIYHGGADELLELAQSVPDSAESLMLFGHNPTMSEFANRMGRNAPHHLSPCSVVRIDLDVAEWKEAGKEKGETLWHEHPEKNHDH